MTRPNDDAIRTWLWMQAMNSACNNIWRECKRKAVPDEDARRYMPFDQLVERSYQYALEHWQDVVNRIRSSGSGSCSGESHYCTGYWLNADSRGITAEFHEGRLAVSIIYTEVRRFIERLLAPPTIEDRQMTMLEILSMVAPL